MYRHFMCPGYDKTIIIIVLSLPGPGNSLWSLRSHYFIGKAILRVLHLPDDLRKNWYWWHVLRLESLHLSICWCKLWQWWVKAGDYVIVYGLHLLILVCLCLCNWKSGIHVDFFIGTHFLVYSIFPISGHRSEYNTVIISKHW